MKKSKKEEIRQLIQRLDPVNCNSDGTKKIPYCPGRKGKRLCCWYCSYLDYCVNEWNKGNLNSCKRYIEKLWCSAVEEKWRQRHA